MPKVDSDELNDLRKGNFSGPKGGPQKSGIETFQQTLQVQGVFNATVDTMTQQGLRLPNPHLNNFVWSYRETPGYSQAVSAAARTAGMDVSKIMDCDQQVRHAAEQMKGKLPGATFYQLTLKNQSPQLDDPLGRREHQIMGIEMPDGNKYIMCPWSKTGPTLIGGRNTPWKAAEPHLKDYPGVDKVAKVDQL